MIFAAGIGSRLKPFTDTKPKALLPVQGKPLLQHNIERLIQFGVRDFVINVHHFADQIIEFLQKKNYFGVNIKISDERDELLDTGGGLEKAKFLLEGKDPIILQNADVITDISYQEMLRFHIENNAIATLAVQGRQSSRYLRFNMANELCGWENVKTGEEIESKKETQFLKLAFSGVHVISQDFLQHINMQGSYGIVKIYLELAKVYKILGYKHDQNYWFDVGTPEKLADLNEFLQTNNIQ